MVEPSHVLLALGLDEDTTHTAIRIGIGRFNIKEEKLVPGLYVTVEPGIYIPEDDDIPPEFRGIGVRIEDDVIVTDTGYEVLTSEVVKEIDQIEKIVGSKI